MFGTWKYFLESIVLMKIPINHKEFILQLLLTWVTVQSDPRDLRNPVFFLSLSWKLSDNENSAFHGQAVKYTCGLLITHRLLKNSTY